MVVDTKLYDILGVSPAASDADLRRAYKQQAMQWHPDKNKDDPTATDKFQQINEAYEILKDPSKRQVYDQYGPEGLRGDNGGMDNIFSHLFGGSFFGRSRGSNSQRRPRTQDIQHEISVTLEDLYNGKEVTLKITRDILCPDCNGNGCVKGKNPRKCTDCDGQGRKLQVQRMGPMITQQIITCPSCCGVGELIDSKDHCKKCHGKKVVDEKKSIVVHIEPGMEHGEKIVFSNCSDEAPEADTGDLVIRVKQIQHNKWERRHDDLLILKRITLSQALFPQSFVVKHLDGRQLVICPQPGSVIAPDSVKVIEREGMPRRGNSFEKGRLFVKFEVVFPKGPELTTKFKEELEKILPRTNETAGIDENDENVFKATMKDSDLKQFQNAQSSRERRREAYGGHQDDDEDERGGRRAQCQPM
jgi:DnaJ-class molecular chaperone